MIIIEKFPKVTNVVPIYLSAFLPLGLSYFFNICITKHCAELLSTDKALSVGRCDLQRLLPKFPQISGLN